MRRLMAGLVVAAVVGMSATGALADDTQIAQTIVQRLQVEQNKGNLKGFNVGVRVDHGDVWMEGQVANPNQQNLVLDIARRVPGVKQVVNDISIGQAAPPASLAVASEPDQQSGKSLLTGLGSAVRTAIVQQPEQMQSAPPAVVATAPAVMAQPIAPLKTAPRMPVATRPQLAVAPQLAATPQLTTAPKMVVPNATLGSQPNTGIVSAPNQHLAHLAQNASYGPVRGQVPATQVVRQMPRPYAPTRLVSTSQPMGMGNAPPMPSYVPGTGGGVSPAVYDHPNMPGYAWPAYASHPNYAGLTYPKQYSPTAWPYIGPFYPYPQVPLGWRKVVLEWDDGWWMLDFKSKTHR
jgi:hypothetical protein